MSTCFSDLENKQCRKRIKFLHQVFFTAHFISNKSSTATIIASNNIKKELNKLSTKIKS